VTFVGRLANYRHFTMDEATRNALDVSGRRSSTTTGLMPGREAAPGRTTSDAVTPELPAVAVAI
jgi:hypothetical protein